MPNSLKTRKLQELNNGGQEQFQPSYSPPPCAAVLFRSDILFSFFIIMENNNVI